MQSHLLIKINKDKTLLTYIDSGEKIHTHEYNYGYADADNKHKFLAGIMYMLEMINLIDVIPEKYIVDLDIATNDMNDISAMRHKYHWYGEIIRRYNYTQFVRSTNDTPCVIINTNERHKDRNKLGLKI